MLSAAGTASVLSIRLLIMTPLDSSIVALNTAKPSADVWPDNSGGALCITNFDKVMVSHCLFTCNRAGGPVMEGPGGGALYLAFADIELIGNTFSLNRAPDGGAVAIHESNPIFIENVFTDNQAVSGGAVSVGGYFFSCFQQR